ncbi:MULTISPECIES: hypothetical protein [Pseudomonas]|uniref:hypothetical protein n=3 Tax=Pseudomonas TaxID=286 RepID=UPI000357B489|nr:MULTISPECIES: hypothetical protein [unclassified Pseudomonas]OKP67684.1 hypothetical protein BTR19_23175 [Pseudomonas fluorescens]EPJ88571.1 hypothetical protein CFT9_04201 [Pseudomonas sp. CFT9]EPL07948.1 hypothetical protein CF150_23088 [Pseudomonas sp. CF150]MCF5561443.1 hypothetical protein [Pseudomonas sp. PA-3-5D]MCF5597090.1 hypothetical protein [Pseudomonas sp. PA-3-10C]
MTTINNETNNWVESLSKRAIALGTFHDWPKPELVGLTDQEIEKFQLKFLAMKLYCEGLPLNSIVAATGINRQCINYYASRCMQLAPDGLCWGCRALLPYLHTKKYSRSKQAAPKLPEAQGGYSGLLGAVLKKYPDLESRFIRKVLSYSDPESESEYAISSKTLHKIFLASLKEFGVKEDEWPFNTLYQGQRTIYDYIKNIRESNFSRMIRLEGTREAKAHMAVGKGPRPGLVYTEPFEAVEIDGYKIDCHSSVLMKAPNGTYIPKRISRIWVVLMIDCASGAVLSYKCVFRSEISATDVVDVMRYSVVGQQKPEPGIEGLIYPEGSGLPNDVIPQCKGALFTVVKFDGALAHLSVKVTNAARKELGYFWTVGAPAHFERRPCVEHVFGLLSNNVFCRLLSTTGHGPNNGRAENCEEVATQAPILVEHLLHLLDVEIAQHNTRMSEGLFFLSPLDFIRQKLEKDHQHFMVRTLPDASAMGDTILQMKKTVNVRGSKKNGRHPYIQFMKVRYTSSYLHDAWAMIGSKVVLHIDENDLRFVTAFTMEGFLLGKLVAVGKWADTKHDLRTRKAINSKVADRTLQVSFEQDPVLAYLAFLSKSKSKKSIAISADSATEAKRVASEAGAPLVVSGSANNSIPALEGKPLEFSDSLIIGRKIPDLNELLRKRRLK